MRKLLAVLGLLVVVVPGLAQEENPFSKAVIDWFTYVEEWRGELGGPFFDASVDPIGLDDLLFLRKVVGLNSRALESLYTEITESGPISTLERLSRVKYCGSITVLTKILLFWTFPDEQAVFAKNPKLLSESYSLGDYVWVLIRWAEEGGEQ